MTWLLALAAGGMVWKIVRWTTKVDSAVDGFSDFVKEIRDFVKEIRSNITELIFRLPLKPVAGNSPLRLTELGEKMAEFMNAKAWVNEHAVHLKVQTVGKQEFEIGDLSRQEIQRQYQHDVQGLRNSVAACAYEFGLKSEDVIDVLQVVLREELLKRRPVGPPDGD